MTFTKASATTSDGHTGTISDAFWSPTVRIFRGRLAGHLDGDDVFPPGGWTAKSRAGRTAQDGNDQPSPDGPATARGFGLC
jgi:hypothetical protein